jgi:cell division protease FtsH
MSGGNDDRKYAKSITNRNGRFGTNSNVIVLAATNRADVLDKALMRRSI